MKSPIFSLLPEELAEKICQFGHKKFRAKQILNWVYLRGITDFEQMTNLPQMLRKQLAEHFDLSLPVIESEYLSKDGTRKFLLRLNDNNYIEMVLIPAEDKLTLCISSQVGCKRGCRFCATSRLGLIRNLNVEEITMQVYLARQLAESQKLTNLVFMGMGEPLDNFENVIKAIKILQADQCFSISPRRITVSTCGVVPGIIKLGESGLKVKLAVSLNAAINEKRKKLMPVTESYPLEKLKEALKTFSRNNPFRITFEYVMIKEFNLGKEDQKALKKFIGDISSKVNLIAWNPVPGLKWETPSDKEIEAFKASLYRLSGVAITTRNSRGSDINAACGMLAGKKKKVLP